MVLSKMTLNLRDKAARRDIANPYEMHSTLMRLVDSGASKPLWRLERGRSDSASVDVLIQTDRFPDCRVLHEVSPSYYEEFESRDNLLIERVARGDVLCFRLRANPTVTREGKRRGLLRAEEQLGWLARKLRSAGAELLGSDASEAAKLEFTKRDQGDSVVLMGVTFDGQLEVADPEELRRTVRAGIGPAKSLGFGLLTLARC